jgi:hypothetical protein
MFRRLRRAFLRANISLLPNNALVWRRVHAGSGVNGDREHRLPKNSQTLLLSGQTASTHNASKSSNEALNAFIFGFENEFGR